LGCTVGELLTRIDSRELTEWEAYERVAGPVGPERLDHLMAMLQATIANVNRGKSQRPYRPDQFMPEWGVAAPKNAAPMSGEELLEQVKKINRKMGGTQGGNTSRSAHSDRD
jgi:hypothetical protein